MSNEKSTPLRDLVTFYEVVERPAGEFHMMCADAEGHLVILNIPQSKLRSLAGALKKYMD